MRVLAIAFCVSARLLAEDVGTIEGTVVDKMSHASVKRAAVRLMGGPVPQPPPKAGDSGTFQQPKTVISDATGSYTFRDLLPGTYNVAVFHPLYAARPGYTPVRQVRVSAGQKTSLDVELIPSGAVSGKVVDEDGDPMMGCAVTARAAVNQFTTPSFTNEAGEYRIFALPPGKYYVAAQCPQPAFTRRPLSPGPPGPPSEAYAPQFYPNATAKNSAERIDIGPGAERSGIDFRMSRTAVRVVRATVRIEGKELAPEQIYVELLSKDREVTDPGYRVPGARNGSSSFEFYSVLPGPYIVIARTFEPTGIGYSAQAEVEVGGRPMEQVTLELRRAVDVSGTVEVEDGGMVDLKQISIQLLPREQVSMPGVNAEAKEDGSFTLPKVGAARWRVEVFSPEAYVKSVLIDNQILEGRELDTINGVKGPLLIRLGTRTGSLSGTVIGDTPGAGAGKMVVVMPRDVTQGVNSYNKMGRSDMTGRFSIAKLRPGKYWVFAVEDVNTGFYGWDMISGLKDKATEVTVDEAQTATADVKVIELD